ncbi:hypothetical protein ACFL4D_00795 [Candidatus Margulisiibacteriota bacterium]
MSPMIMLAVRGPMLEIGEQAAVLAERKLEHLSGLPFAQIDTAATQNFSAPMNSYSFAIFVDYVLGPYNLNTIAPDTSEYKNARITIAYKGQRQFELATVFTNHEY